MTKIFIDGSAGTTGLRIYDRLVERKDIELISLSEENRKDISARKEALNAADIVFLCLPDDAAKESVSLIENSNVKVIDTSTAHRTMDGWAYGFPELKGQKEKIKNSNRIANPGCYASGFISLVKPLVDANAIDISVTLSCFAISGYSGGGKKMITAYEAENRDPLFDGPRMYGLTQSHKHLPEMKIISGLCKEPIFVPYVASYYSGMQVTIALPDSCKLVKNDIESIYADYYKEGFVRFVKGDDENGFMSCTKMAGRDDMHVTVEGNDNRILLISRFDNLGKGASGAAIQNMNILMGSDEGCGLIV